MPYFCRLVMLLLTAWALQATDRYVAPAPTGDDTHAGTAGSPWATIGHAMAASASGDRILIKAGATYREAGGTIGGGRQLAATGFGTMPVITAAVVQATPGTWVGNANVRTGACASQPLACYVNGTFLHLARYPDSGFLRCDNGSTAYGITDGELPARASGYWTGAQVHWRRWSWWWETRPITVDNGADRLTLGGTPAVDSTSDGYGNSLDAPDNQGSGYFIDNSLKALDAPGEWFWDGSTIYVYPPTGTNPATMTVEVVTTSSGWTCSGGSVNGIAFRRFAGTALAVTGPSTIDGCVIEQVEDTGIGLSWNAAPSLIRNCTLRDVRNIGITWNENPAGAGGTIVERNLLHRIGADPGYGGSGSWHAAGMIIFNAKGGTIRLNRIVDTGYAGVIVGQDGQTISRNVFVRCMGTLNDGAAIYTNCSATTISENIILDTVGDLSTSQPWIPMGHGIWPEFLGAFHDTIITDNTVYGSNGNGIFLPNNFHCTISGNVLMDNRRAGLDLDIKDGDHSTQDHAITGNTLVVVAATRRIPRAEHLMKWWLSPYAAPLPDCLAFAAGTDFGSMAATTFIAPAAGAQDMVRGDGASWSDLASWAAANPTWAVASDRVVRADSVLLFNDTETATAVAVPAGTWTLPDGSAVGATVTIQPFRSVVLVTDAVMGAITPYHSASGIDWRSASPVGTTPLLTVVRGGLGILSGSTEAVTGTVANTTRILTYDLANTGTVPVNILGNATINWNSNCSVVVSTHPSGSIAPGATSSAALDITVTPSASGAWSFFLTVPTDDPNGHTWTVSGNATAVATPEARVLVGPTIVSVGGSQSVSGLVAGSTTAITCSIGNVGSAAMTISAVDVVSASACTVVVSPQPASPVAVGGSTDLAVRVTPTQADGWSATLRFTSNDGAHSPYTWTLSGVASPGGDGTTGGGGAGGGGGCGAGAAAGLLALAMLASRLRRRHRS